MGILIYNYVGLIATLVVYLPLLVLIDYLETTGWTRTQAMALFFVGGSTCLAIFALFWDRRDRGDFFGSYWTNYRQLIYQSMDAVPPSFDFRVQRRTAMFLVPLAMGPFCVLLGYLILLARASWKGEDTSWGIYTVSSLVSCGLTLTVAHIQAKAGSSNLLNR